MCLIVHVTLTCIGNGLTLLPKDAGSSPARLPSV